MDLKRHFCILLMLVFLSFSCCSKKNSQFVLINNSIHTSLHLISKTISSDKTSDYVVQQYLDYERVEVDDYTNCEITVSVYGLGSEYNVSSSLFINHPSYNQLFDCQLDSFSFEYENGCYVINSIYSKLNKKMLAFQSFIFDNGIDRYYFGINYGYPSLDNEKANDLILKPGDINSISYEEIASSSYEDEPVLIKEGTLEEESIKNAYSCIFENYSLLSYCDVLNYDGSCDRKPGSPCLSFTLNTKTNDKITFLLCSFNYEDRYNLETIIEIEHRDFLLFSSTLYDFITLLDL